MQVGQELSHSGNDEVNYYNGRSLTRSTWHIWVTRVNPDGSSRLVIRSGKYTIAYCDLFPDGRMVDNDAVGFYLRPSTLLPRLPRAAEQASAWINRCERDGALPHAAKQPPSRLVLEVVRESPSDRIYVKNIETFDVARGLVEQINSQTAQNYRFNGHGHGTTTDNERLSLTPPRGADRPAKTPSAFSRHPWSTRMCCDNRYAGLGDKEGPGTFARTPRQRAGEDQHAGVSARAKAHGGSARSTVSRRCSSIRATCCAASTTDTPTRSARR